MNTAHLRVVVLVVLFAAIAGLTAPARAADAFWVGSLSGFWTNDSNWAGGFPPGSGDRAGFDDDNPFIIRTAVILNENRTIGSMVVDGDHFAVGPYSFSRNAGAVLTVLGSSTFGATNAGASTTTLNGFLLNTNTLLVRGQMNAVITGSANVTTTGAMNVNDSAQVNLNGGSLNLAAGTSHNLNSSSTMNVNGGALNLGTNATLNVSNTSTLNFFGGFNVLNNALLRALNGGDIVGTSFIDVGNGGSGFLTLVDAGSTLTAQSSISDWGREAGSNAVIDLFAGTTATVNALRVGTVDSQANLRVRGGSLIVNSTLSAGGGTTSRSVQLTVQDSGTMTVNGTSTFDNQADLNLVSGTLDFNNSATFNAGSRLDITGGTLDTTNQLLTVNGGTLTSTLSGALSSGSALRVQSGGTATFSSFFDIGNGNSGALTVTGAGSTLTAGGTTDWGNGSSGGAVVNIDNGGVANLNSLRIGNSNGTATVTVASGGQLRPNVLTVGGGSNNRTVNLTINGGTVTALDANASNTFNDKAVLNLQAGTFDPKGDVTFFPGSTANWSGGSFLIGSGKTLTVSGGTINRTITTAGGLSPSATLAINSAGMFNSTGSYGVGENGAGTVTVNGTNSVFRTSTNLTLGGSSAGQVGTVTTTNGGSVFVGDNALGFAPDRMVVGDNNPASANAGGKLTIANGSTLNHHSVAHIAPFANTFGTVIVTGNNSRWDVGSNLFMGNSGGNGDLQVLAGGRVGTTLQTVIGLDAASQSTVTVSGTGSTLAVGTVLEVGRAGAGTLNINGGGNVTAASVSVGNAGVLRVFDASMSGNLTLLPNSQMFADNATVGPLTQQAGADLNFTLRGTSNFDNLNVLGPAILQGDLFVTLGGGYTPQSGDSFEFLTATAGLDNANFSSLNLPTLSGGLDWLLNFSPQSLTLSVIGGIDGDFNNDGLYNCSDINSLTATIAAGTNTGSFDLTGDGLVNLADRDAWLSEAGGVNIGPGRAYKLGDANLDGVVDGSDFGIWNGSKFTSSTAWCSGNFNGDAVVDGSDFGIWNGNKFTSSDGVSAIPEPSVLHGLVVALWMWTKSGRRGRSCGMSSGRPFGSRDWVSQAATRLQLRHR